MLSHGNEGASTNEETDQLTLATLEEIHKKLCEGAIPNYDGYFSFIVFFSLWEKIVCWFSPRYALKLYADRQIRNWNKKRNQSEWLKSTSTHVEKISKHL